MQELKTQNAHEMKKEIGKMLKKHAKMQKKELKALQ